MAIVNGTIQHASYTDAQWTAWNGVLLDGQVGYVTDVFYTGTTSQKFKIGNGIDTWNNLDYHPDGGAVTAADNGLGLNGTIVELGINDLNRNTIIEAVNFKWLLQTQIDAFKTVALEKSKIGDIHYSGTYAENTNTNLKAYINTRGATSTNVVAAELAMRDDTNQTITGILALEDGMSGSTRGDLLLSVNTLVGTLTISETVTADNGATGTVRSRTATQVRVLPVSGDWLNAVSITGNTSLATANISAVTTQKWAYGDHNDFLWMVYDEYEGFIIIGHDSAERPNVGVLVRNEVYLLDYPETRDDTGLIPQTNVLYTGPNGEVCSAPFSGGGGNTIYTGDDSLTGNRIVSKAGFNLSFNGAGRHIIEASNNHASDAATIIQGSNAGGGLDIELRAFGSGDIKINSLTSDPDYGSKVVHNNGILRTSQADKQFTFPQNSSFVLDVNTYKFYNYFPIDVSTIPVTVTLDPSATTPTLEFKIKDVNGNSSVNNITVVCDGTDTIDGAGSYLINNDYGCLTFVNNGNGTWSVINYYFP